MKLLEQSPPKLIFADDDPATLDVYRAFVESLGWTADYSRTARELIDTVNANCTRDGRCYDALVCDVNFFDEMEGGPRISGVTAAKVIRESHPDLPVVFVTAYNSYLVRDEVSAVGRAEIYQKPVDFEMLFARISYLIRWNRIIAPPAVAIERRRDDGPNESGQYRRRTDGALRIPPVLESLLSEVKAKRAAADGH